MRRQLTLFVPRAEASIIEAVRRRVDPVQFGLIAAHVTLCRDDEVADLTVTELRRRLDRAALAPLTLVFGEPAGFADHGMLLPCNAGAAEFHQLRAAVLDSATVPKQTAHITLAHPRNPRADANTAAAYTSLAERMEICFADVSLIEQRDGGAWVVRGTVPLAGTANARLY